MPFLGLVILSKLDLPRSSLSLLADNHLAWPLLIWGIIFLFSSPRGKSTVNHLTALFCSSGMIRLTVLQSFLALVEDPQGALNYPETNKAML